MKSLKQYKEMQMENPEFVKEYESIQPEMDVIRAIICLLYTSDAADEL